MIQFAYIGNKTNQYIYIFLLGENTSFDFLEGFKPIASTSIEPTQVIEISNLPGKLSKCNFFLICIGY